MILIIIALITLYLIISSASLVLICTNDRNGKDAYFDIRNIFVALIWPLVLLGGGLVGLIRWVTVDKKQSDGTPPEPIPEPKSRTK